MVFKQQMIVCGIYYVPQKSQGAFTKMVGLLLAINLHSTQLSKQNVGVQSEHSTSDMA